MRAGRRAAPAPSAGGVRGEAEGGEVLGEVDAPLAGALDHVVGAGVAEPLAGRIVAGGADARLGARQHAIDRTALRARRRLAGASPARRQRSITAEYASRHKVLARPEVARQPASSPRPAVADRMMTAAMADERNAWARRYHDATSVIQDESWPAPSIVARPFQRKRRIAGGAPVKAGVSLAWRQQSLARHNHSRSPSIRLQSSELCVQNVLERSEHNEQCAQREGGSVA